MNFFKKISKSSAPAATNEDSFDGKHFAYADYPAMFNDWDFG